MLVCAHCASVPEHHNAILVALVLKETSSMAFCAGIVLKCKILVL